MSTDPLASALEGEHRQIDESIAAYVDGSATSRDPQPLRDAIAVLRMHVYVEEEFLFRALNGHGPQLVAPIFVMEREHGQMWSTLDELVIELRLGGDDPTAAIGLCRKLASELLHHNGKEEQIIYSQIDTLLAPEVRDRVLTTLTSAELPDNWVPRKARL